MPRQHFIVQSGPHGYIDEKKVKHLEGACCGAVCLTYLFGELIEGENPQNEYDIFDDCRVNTKCADVISDATNPYRIQCYLKGNLYSGTVRGLIGNWEFNAVPKIWEASAEENAINQVYGDIMRRDAGRVFPDEINGISEVSPMGEAAIRKEDMQEGSFFLGVFKSGRCAGGLPSDPAELHYILLKKDDGKLWYNNPHNNTWIEASIEGISGGFVLEGGAWVWANYGLYITAARK